jgi:hypothetical protein
MKKNCASCEHLFREEKTGVWRCDNPKALNGRRISNAELVGGCKHYSLRKEEPYESESNKKDRSGTGESPVPEQSAESAL